jgi:hypothetical protein
MTSPYLEQPLVPLAVALPQMLENIEADLADSKLDAVQTERLRWRAELIRWLLMPRRDTQPLSIETGALGAGRAQPAPTVPALSLGAGCKPAINHAGLVTGSCPVTSTPSASRSAKPPKPAMTSLRSWIR